VRLDFADSAGGWKVLSGRKVQSLVHVDPRDLDTHKETRFGSRTTFYQVQNKTGRSRFE
jgi:hypothetical protein